MNLEVNLTTDPYWSVYDILIKLSLDQTKPMFLVISPTDRILLEIAQASNGGGCNPTTTPLLLLAVTEQVFGFKVHELIVHFRLPKLVLKPLEEHLGVQSPSSEDDVANHVLFDVDVDLVDGVVEHVHDALVPVVSEEDLADFIALFAYDDVLLVWEFVGSLVRVVELDIIVELGLVDFEAVLLHILQNLHEGVLLDIGREIGEVVLLHEGKVELVEAVLIGQILIVLFGEGVSAHSLDLLVLLDQHSILKDVDRGGVTTQVHDDRVLFAVQKRGQRGCVFEEEVLDVEVLEEIIAERLFVGEGNFGTFDQKQRASPGIEAEFVEEILEVEVDVFVVFLLAHSSFPGRC